MATRRSTVVEDEVAALEKAMNGLDDTGGEEEDGQAEEEVEADLLREEEEEEEEENEDSEDSESDEELEKSSNLRKEAEDGTELNEWQMTGSEYIGRVVRRSVSDPERDGVLYAEGIVIAWLPASESDFVDARGRPAALYRIKYCGGWKELRDDVEDLELNELFESFVHADEVDQINDEGRIILSEYEQLRIQNIERNKSILASLGLASEGKSLRGQPKAKSSSTKNRKRKVQTLLNPKVERRTSARVAKSLERLQEDARIARARAAEEEEERRKAAANRTHSRRRQPSSESGQGDTDDDENNENENGEDDDDEEEDNDEGFEDDEEASELADELDILASQNLTENPDKIDNELSFLQDAELASQQLGNITSFTPRATVLEILANYNTPHQ